jgi:hypothetical protein
VGRFGGTFVTLVVGLTAAACSANPRDTPERSFSLPNNAGSSRDVRRCEWVDDCRSPKKGETVEPGDSFDFDMYADEERAYVVSDGEEKTLGCLTIHIADGSQPYPPDSLADARISACPPGTPKTVG